MKTHISKFVIFCILIFFAAFASGQVTSVSIDKTGFYDVCNSSTNLITGTVSYTFI